ncbi:hypothetical protein PFISCL1PPCAC_24969, partial [Pristionchus fissidentatus]
IVTLTFFSHITRSSISTVRLDIPGGLFDEIRVCMTSTFLSPNLILLFVPVCKTWDSQQKVWLDDVLIGLYINTQNG